LGAARFDGRHLDRGTGTLTRLMLDGRRADGNRHVRHALALEVRAALGARIQTLRDPAARAAVDRDLRDEETVARHVVIVFRVGHGRLEQLDHRLRREHAGELQQHERFAHGFTANRIGDAAQLARTHAGELQVGDRNLRTFGNSSHYFTEALSPA
jgi:hypothetical protein